MVNVVHRLFQLVEYSFKKIETHIKSVGTKMALSLLVYNSFLLCTKMALSLLVYNSFLLCNLGFEEFYHSLS